MTFREPAVLLGLALLPVAMLAYAAMQSRRQREAAAFGSPALMPNIVTGRPGWRRHLPALLLLLALAALIFAVARPQRSVAAPSARPPSCSSTTSRARCAPTTSTPTG